ncbi:MAG: hypothetical protein KDE53_34545, partial [Caldilineaceae bacterium]|nr:hypothetical protein [Caldilineaceae bacterium]
MGWRKLPQWDSNYNSALGIALDHLALGRTYLLEAQLTSASLADADLQKAELELRLSVSLLRRAGTEHHLPRGLLALAELGRTQAVVAEKSEREALLTQAERALDEVEQIAERGNMVPFQIDAAVERARVALVREDRAAGAAQLAQA